MLQASSIGRWGHKPGAKGVRGLRMWTERNRGQHDLLGTKAPKRKGLSVSTGQESQHCGYRKRSMLYSRNLGASFAV